MKIDRTFVHTLHQRSQTMKIFSAIVGFGHGLGLIAIAEVIEPERDAHALRQLSCSVGQGFFYIPSPSIYQPYRH
ncbi:MAG: EAL domain-containing protein [Gammaproteobacteria bacterium]